jgi:hypothetical protein
MIAELASSRCLHTRAANSFVTRVTIVKTSQRPLWTHTLWGGDQR